MSKISLTLNNNSIEIEGEPDFIESHLDLIKKIELFSGDEKRVESKNDSSKNESEPENNNSGSDISSLYPNVYFVDKDEEGKFEILAEPKGLNPEKTRAIALLYIYAKKELTKNGSAEAGELRELAKKFGCFDSKNFAAQIAATKPFLSISGKKRGNKTYNITIPGEREARKIASELNSQIDQKNSK